MKQYTANIKKVGVKLFTNIQQTLNYLNLLGDIIEVWIMGEVWITENESMVLH